MRAFVSVRNAARYSSCRSPTGFRKKYHREKLAESLLVGDLLSAVRAFRNGGMDGGVGGVGVEGGY